MPKRFLPVLFLTCLCLAPAVFAQTPFDSLYSYDVSKLPQNVILGGAGAKLDVATPNVSGAYGFGAYAHLVAPGLYEYNQFSIQGGATTAQVGAAGYLGTIGGKVVLLGVAAPGVSFTPPTKTAAGAIGNITTLGGHAAIGIHKFPNGWTLMALAGGTRDLSNQAQVDSWNIHFGVGFSK